MIFNPVNSIFTARHFLIALIGCVFCIFSTHVGCFAQNNKDDIELMFVKQNDSIKSTDLYFNVLKIWNKSAKPFAGNLTITAPENWKVISFLTDITTVNAGDSALIPIRISPVSNAIGGISYIITATLRNNSHILSANTYLTLPKQSKWEFATKKGNIYFTEINPSSTFEIKLANKGNTNELIKIQIKAGKLLSLTNKANNTLTEYIELPAFKDTIIAHPVSFQENISYTDRLKYENNWKESSISISASTDQLEKTSAIQIQKMNSVFYNLRSQNASPLNFDYQAYNIFSNQALRNNFKLYGTVQFPKNREIQYYAGLQNVYFNNTSNDRFDFNRQSIYSILYTDNQSSIQLGYNVGGGILHTINGRGIVGDLKFNNRSRINYAVIQNPFNNLIGGTLGYSMNIKKITLNTEVVHERNLLGNYSASSALFGAGFGFLKYNTINIQVLGSQANYRLSDTPQPKDTSVIGYSYRIDYSFRLKKFELHASALNSENNYILNAGLVQLYLDSKLKINNKFYISLYGNRQSYANASYPYNFSNPLSYTSTDYARLATSFSVGDIVCQIGPNYNGSSKQSINSQTGYKSEYLTYQPGLWASTTFKLNGYRSITPNMTISNIRFYYNTNDPNSRSYSYDKDIYYTAGLNYFDNIWRVNAYYSSGSVSDLYRSVLVDATPTVSRSLQFRPAYENYFFNRTVKLSAYINYAYYLPSGRENTSYNIKYDHFMKKGWSLSVSGFMYVNTRVDKEIGRVSTKDINFVIGLSKSFNIQQPRQKYYDFKSVFFNDLDGNRIKTDNEPPVPNILVNIQKDQTVKGSKNTIPEVQLISDIHGEVSVVNLPKDNYIMTFEPLQNLQSLYFINGSEQKYYNEKERIFYVPLAESYKIRGKIILNRDPNSSEGKIDLGGIRVMATGQKGETFSVLTDNSGAYVLSVPNADKYKVHVNNVFGEQFSIETNEFTVQFTQNKTINLDFTFIEKKRGIQFENGNSDLFSFNDAQTEQVAVVSAPEFEKNIPVPAEKPKSYGIQLATTKTYRDPSTFKRNLNTKADVQYTEKNGVFTYFLGDYPTLKSAQAAIKKLGLVANALEVDRTQLQTAKPKVQAITPQPTVKSGNEIPQSGSSQQAIPVQSTGGNLQQKVTQPQSENSTNVTNNEPIVTPIIAATVVAPITPQPNSTQVKSGRPNNKPSTLTDKPITDIQTDITKNDSEISKEPSRPVSATNNKVSNNQPISSQPTASPTKSERPKNAVVTKTQPNPDKLTIIDGAVVKNPSNVSTPTTLESASKPLPVTKQPEVNSNIIVQKANEKPATKVATVQKEPEALPPVIESKPTAAKKTTDFVEKQSTIQQPATTAKNTAKKEDSKISKTDKSSGLYLFTIQLDALRDNRDPKYYKEKFRLPYDVICIARGSLRYYYVGNYVTVDEASADIAHYGLTGIIVPIEESVVIENMPVKK